MAQPMQAARPVLTYHEARLLAPLMGSFRPPTVRSTRTADRGTKKRRPAGRPLNSCVKAQLPVALSTLIETPGPMVELIDTFFM